ncbi:DUF2520 domain-containing protein [Gillisia sp. M10.2A]|uniref:DUF2520 domain-containing protein n=1 Tax=Gillisia lutea TaxID=2909668 RepID=A0ABS9EF12_9FLAO|nr:DUF2520 domain-containing protein [Gillisia lutea]MCF4101464.1 DUF2520 domain-containing protein [Gillisia lutea]
MTSIVIFGTGNVAKHLFEAFQLIEDFKVIQIYNHSRTSLQYFEDKAATTTLLEEVVEADIYLLALKDDVLQQTAKHLSYRKALMAHTSGANSIEIFKDFDRYGLFYPLQTFSKNRHLDLSNVPLCIESNNENDLDLLEKLASKISSNIYKISFQQRKALHVAAVFANNFVNYLYTEAEEIAKNNDVPFEILHPLIIETAAKITQLSPKEAQTGPAKRNDLEVITAHLKLLNTEQKEIYQLLTKSIQHLHGKEL